MSAAIQKAKESIFGCFEGIPSSVYHKELPGYSKTDLDAAEISAANVIQRRKFGEVDSDSLRLGQAMHFRLEHFDNEAEYLAGVLAAPKVDKRTTIGKEAWAKFEAESANSSKIILTQEEWDENEELVRAMCAHPEAHLLLKTKGLNEETFIWQDKDTGVICRIRPDRRLLEAPKGLPENIVIDWKTIKSCDKREISKSIYDRRYHVQAAFITDGLKAVLGIDATFVNVFIEKGPFKRIVCAVMPDHDIDRGRQEYKKNLATIAQCEQSGIWPGFVDIGLPDWSR